MTERLQTELGLLQTELESAVADLAAVRGADLEVMACQPNNPNPKSTPGPTPHPDPNPNPNPKPKP